MQRNSRFWDRIAARYAKMPVSDEAAYQNKIRLTQALLGADMQVLEFGCGTGTTALLHAPYVRHILAIDISARMLDIAKTKADSAGIKNVTFRQAGLDDLEGFEAHYDVVMGHSILHLLEDRNAAIANVYKMLKPGGLFISSTPCLGGWLYLLQLILPVGRMLGLLPVVKFFSEDSLRHSLQTAGFRLEQEWQPGKGKALFLVARKPVERG